jgi:hypothetical protein
MVGHPFRLSPYIRSERQDPPKRRVKLKLVMGHTWVPMKLPSQAQEGCSPNDRSQEDAWQHVNRQ